NHLAIKIVLEASKQPKRLVSDPLFFPFALNQLTRSPALKRFSGFRTCLAVYQTLRDLSDGGISPEVFEQVLREVREAPELAKQIDFEDSFSLHRMYEAFEGMLNRNGILNLTSPVPAAVDLAESWIQAHPFSSLFIYGFYDCTQTQFDLLEILIRSIPN